LTLATLLGPTLGAAAVPEPAPDRDGTVTTRERGEAYARLMRAVFSVRRGEVGRAVEEVREALALVPDSPDLLTEAANLLLQWTGRVGDSERLARRALELDGDHEGATRFLAEVAAARALGPEPDAASRAEAIRLYEKLAAGDAADRPDVLRMLAELRLKAGDLDGAVREVRRLVAERPGELWATKTLVQLLLRSGRELEALDALLEYAVGHPSHEEMLGWVEQLAGSQRAWPAVVEFLDPRAPFSRDAAALNRFYGEALLRVGRMESAAGALEEALAARPSDVRARKDLALAYRGVGRMAESAAIFRDLVRQSPDYPYMHQLLAETLSEQNDIEGALQAYRTALRGLADSGEVAASHRDAIRLEIARLQLGGGRYAEAGSALVELELPPNPRALLIQCRLAIDTAAWDEARALAERLLEADEPGMARLLEGEIAVGERKWSRAEARFEEAIALLGPYRGAAIAEIYREAGRPEQGLELLNRWAEEEPELADARFHLGVYLYELDRFGEAEHELREAFRLNPKHDRALNFLGYSLAERKIRLEEALEMIERALEVDAWNGAYLDSLGWVYYQLGRYEEARQPLERAARELPTDSTVLEHLGDLHLSLGDREGAVEVWSRALAAGPDDPETLHGKIRRESGGGEQLAADDARASTDPSPR
jgi:tetratricopeptide (TPR) repeat protein